MKNAGLTLHWITRIETSTDSGAASEWRYIIVTDRHGDEFKITLFGMDAIPDIIDRDAEAEQTLQHQAAMDDWSKDDNGCDRN